MYEPRCEKTGLRGFRPGPTQNQAVQPQKMASGLKFGIYIEEGLYYPSSENKGADQLRGYSEADLRPRFRICKKPVFSRRGSYNECLKGFSSVKNRHCRRQVALYHALTCRL